MALAAALASWDEPCTSTFAAWRAEIAAVSLGVFMSVPANIRLKRWSRRLYILGILGLLNPHNFLLVSMITRSR
jgi:hypothetical protein